MSSVLRSYAQTPSKFFWSHGADLWSLDDIKAAFRGQNGSSYSGPEPEYSGSMILFDTEDNFKDATYELLNNSSNTYYAQSYWTHKDMGKDLYIGIKGATSHIIMSLVGLAGEEGVGYGLTGVSVNKTINDYYDEDIDVDLIRGAK